MSPIRPARTGRTAHRGALGGQDPLELLGYGRGHIRTEPALHMNGRHVLSGLVNAADFEGENRWRPSCPCKWANACSDDSANTDVSGHALGRRGKDVNLLAQNELMI